jgi:hypothetical protein
MADFKDWSEGWIKEGYYISFLKANEYYFERVVMRDLLHYEWDWSDPEGNLEAIPALQDAGPVVPEFLEVTKEYDPDKNENRIWQVIFGIKGQVYIYVELPADTHRHGLPKVPKPRSNLPRVSHFEEWMSPFDEPSFITEHFMMRPDLDRIAFSAYNPNNQVAQEGKVTLNFFINSMVTERVGTVVNGSLNPTSSRWQETLDKLWRGLIPCRPITLYPVTMPAEAHH